MAGEYYALGVMNLLFLLVGVVVFTIVNVYLMVRWQHPEDKNQWVSAKIVVLMGMLVCGFRVLEPGTPSPPPGPLARRRERLASSFVGRSW